VRIGIQEDSHGGSHCSGKERGPERRLETGSVTVTKRLGRAIGRADDATAVFTNTSFDGNGVVSPDAPSSVAADRR
jgi:hypothetical protein